MYKNMQFKFSKFFWTKYSEKRIANHNTHNGHTYIITYMTFSKFLDEYLAYFAYELYDNNNVSWFLIE